MPMPKCKGRGCTNDAIKVLDARHPDGHWFKLPVCGDCLKKLEPFKVSKKEAAAKKAHEN